MKTLLGIIAGLLIVGVGYVLFVSGGTQSPDAGENLDEVNSQELSGTATYVVDPEASEIIWTGSKTLVSNYEDFGTVEVATSSGRVEDGSIVEAEIVIDMTTIETTSTSNEVLPASRLTTHLRSNDFFAVEDFPTATLTVTEVADPNPSSGILPARYEKQVTADLTIKGQTHEIVFPAQIYATENGELIVDSKFQLDRTHWDVRFGSDQFFDNLGNNVIDDEFTLDVYLVAVPEDQATDDGENEEVATTTEDTSTSSNN